MVRAGCVQATGSNVKKKFENMKTTFKKIKRSHHQSGAGRTRFEYFRHFDELFARDPTVNPDNILVAGSRFNRILPANGNRVTPQSQRQDVNRPVSRAGSPRPVGQVWSPRPASRAGSPRPASRAGSNR